ncbi:MAG: hypothetical protein HQL21_04430 [Candidatus Omnitrophica bacterium]|nr:hypothetical protein [Candidatus Omnitrophota bacterium]
MRKNRVIFWKCVDGQSMVEVAVFGAIIVFLIGALVKNVTTTSFAQQYALRTMREALTGASEKRFAFMDPLTNDKIKIQKPYNLLIVEDRLFPGVTKYGSTERAPYITNTNAVFSKDLFKAPYMGSDVEVPVLHMRVNGRTFKYTLGAWRQMGNTGCSMAERTEPSSGGIAWKSVTKTAEDLVKIMKEDGRAMCYDGGSIAPVFQKLPSGEPPDFWMMDPKAGQMNPYDAKQGLQPDVIIKTTSEGTLTVPTNGKGSTSTIEQGDVVTRFFNTNQGQMPIVTSIKSNRSHSW